MGVISFFQKGFKRRPLSASIIEPVIPRALSLARYIINSPISSGVPTLFRGVLSLKSSKVKFAPMFSKKSVATGPGLTLLTLIPVTIVFAYFDVTMIKLNNKSRKIGSIFMVISLARSSLIT